MHIPSLVLCCALLLSECSSVHAFVGTDDNRPQNPFPTKAPILSKKPTKKPSTRRTSRPSRSPTRKPTAKKSARPSIRVSRRPTSPTIRPSRRPTRKPTVKKTASPSKRLSATPTARRTIKPTNKPNSPSNKPTKRPTRKPSRKPSALPINASKSRYPTSQPNIPSSSPSLASSNTDICTNSGAGDFGLVTQDLVIVPYKYQMTLSSSSNTSAIVEKMEVAISDLTWPTLSSCNTNSTTQRRLQPDNGVRVVGLSSNPPDAASDCVDAASTTAKCILVTGSLKVFFAENTLVKSTFFSNRRNILDLNQSMTEVLTNVNQIIDDGMKSGKFLSVSPDILGLTYLGTDYKPAQSSNGYQFPKYGYAVIVCSIVGVTAFTLALFGWTHKRRNNRKNRSTVDPEDIDMETAMDTRTDDPSLPNDKPTVHTDDYLGTVGTGDIKYEKTPKANNLEQRANRVTEVVLTPLSDSNIRDENQNAPEESSLCDDDTNSNAPLLVHNAAKTSEDSNGVEDIVNEPETGGVDIDEISSTASDQDSKVPLLYLKPEAEVENRVEPADSPDQINHQMLVHDFNDDASDELSENMSDCGSKAPLIKS